MTVAKQLLQAFLLFQAGLAAVLIVRALLHRYAVRADARALAALWLLPLLLVATHALPELNREQWPAAVRWAEAIPSAASLSSGLAQSGHWLPMMGSVWLLGALTMVLAALLEQRRMNRQTIPDPDMMPVRGVHISRAAFGPAVLGFFRPRIVLPHDFEHRFNAAQRELVLAHEGQHIAAWHLPKRALAWLMLALNWPSPLSWYAWVRFVDDQEAACDAGALSRLARTTPEMYAQIRHDYAMALSQQLSVSIADSGFSAVCRMQARHPTLRRIAMLRYDSNASRRTSAIAVGALLLVLSALAWAVQQQPGATKTQTPSSEFYRIEFTLSVDKSTPEQFALIGRANERLGIKSDLGQVTMDFTVKPSDDAGSIVLSATIARKGQVIAEPTLISRIGGDARISVDAADGAGHFDLSYVVFRSAQPEPGSDGR